ncbi:MAG: hypothetical protein KDD52_01675 [Bdellovibrionales bacterium]|nr:hypothetical protein [Bdellovibrionales bacterium]
MKAKLIYHHKAKLHGKYILELSIHDVGKSQQYPDGIKYGLICINFKTRERILMDNHHPKGPHIHIGKDQLLYVFESEEKLIEDFKSLVFKHLGVRL